MKFIEDKNLSFYEDGQEKIVKSEEKAKIVDTSKIKILSSSEVKKRKKFLSMFDKVILIINVVTNILFLFFMNNVLNGFYFTDVVNYSFNAVNIIGIVIFSIAQISGLYLLIKMFIKVRLPLKLVIATAPLILLFAIISYGLINVDMLSTGNAKIVLDTIGFDVANIGKIDFKYVLISSIVFLVLLYGIFTLLLRKYFIRKEKLNNNGNNV